ncbi:MAG: site-specific integrase [Lactobacillus sp.]|jgi:integrase|nr:site-specific integrase [Lactobacillus sp.]MCI2032102.1 site-specific integrase [Lactobacillus sp.]
MPKPKQYTIKSKTGSTGKQLKPEKRWMIKGYLGIDPKTGIDKYTTLRGFETALEASDAFDDAKYNLRHGIIQPDHEFTLDEVYELWLKERSNEVTSGTMLSNKSAYRNQIKDVFGHYYLDRVTPLDAQHWVNGLTVKINGPLSVLSMILSFAVRMGWLSSNPCREIKRPRGSKRAYAIKKDKRYTLDEARHFIDVLNRKAETNPKLWERRRVVLSLTLATGIRRGELVGLKWEDVDFQRHLLHIRRAVKEGDRGEEVGQTKTASSVRTLALTSDTTAMLAQWCVTQARNLLIEGREISSAQWLFTGRTASGHLSLCTPLSWMQDLSKESDVRNLCLHGLRHTKATILASQGVKYTSIAAILGHSTTETTTRTYIHPTSEGQEEVEADYANLFKLPSGQNLVTNNKLDE